jgi:hypothetical protein
MSYPPLHSVSPPPAPNYRHFVRTEELHQMCWHKRNSDEWRRFNKSILYDTKLSSITLFKTVNMRTSCIAQNTEGKIEGTGRRERSSTQLLDDLKAARRYWKLKEQAFGRTLENWLRKRLNRPHYYCHSTKYSCRCDVRSVLYLFIYLSIHLFYLFIYLFNCLLMYLFIHSFIHSLIHLLKHNVSSSGYTPSNYWTTVNYKF